MEQPEPDQVWPPDEIVATPHGVPDRIAWPSRPAQSGEPGPASWQPPMPPSSPPSPEHPATGELTAALPAVGGAPIPPSPWAQPPNRAGTDGEPPAPTPPTPPPTAPHPASPNGARTAPHPASPNGARTAPHGPAPQQAGPVSGPPAPPGPPPPQAGSPPGPQPGPQQGPQHGPPPGYPQPGPQPDLAGPPTYPQAGPQPGPITQPPAAPQEVWQHDPLIPTAEEFARRRAARPIDPVAATGLRGAVRKATFGLAKLPPGTHEREMIHDIEMVRRNFGGLRQVTVVNPKGGAGKTVAVLLLAMTFGQKRGGYVLAWDNNETQGTLGMRAQQDFHSRTVRDLLRDLGHFRGARGRVGDLSQYVRAQGEGMFDVLASDESATAGEMLTSAAFADIREVVSRFYKLIFVDTGNNVRAANWQAAIDATDQLVLTMSARNDSAETAARMLDHLEQSGRQRLVRQAVTVVSMPPSRKDIDLPAIQRHFAARTRAVLLAPYERLIDSGEPIRYGALSSASREAWLRVASAVAEGL